MKKFRPFTLEERKIIEQMYRTHSRASIGRILNRSPGTISQEIARGFGGVYIAEQIHENVSKSNKHGKNVNLEKRIQNIEFQLEILTTTLQELLNGKNH